MFLDLTNDECQFSQPSQLSDYPGDYFEHAKTICNLWICELRSLWTAHKDKELYAPKQWGVSDFNRIVKIYIWLSW